MELDFRDEFTTWDNTETVQIESARRLTVVRPAGFPQPNPNDADSIPIAKRRNVRGAQKSPSGGVYVGNEAFWLIPAAVLGPGTVFKPADVVIDATQTRWTVLTTELNRHGATWRLGCVNLVIAAALSDSIDVQRPAISYDVAGAAVKAWPDAPAGQAGGFYLAKGRPARVQRTDEAVADQRGIRAFLGKYDVTVATPLAVTFEDRIAWKPVLLGGATLYLDLIGTRHAGLIDELLTIEAEARP